MHSIIDFIRFNYYRDKYSSIPIVAVVTSDESCCWKLEIKTYLAFTVQTYNIYAALSNRKEEVQVYLHSKGYSRSHKLFTKSIFQVENAKTGNLSSQISDIDIGKTESYPLYIYFI